MKETKNDVLLEDLTDTLSEEEVNIYTADCGQIKYHCLTDCFPFSTPMISKSW